MDAATRESFEERARTFAAERLAPAAAGFEADEEVPAAVYRALGERGLMAVNVPEALGGSGAGVVSYARAMMATAQGCASTAVTMAVTNMVGEVVAHFGSEDQKQAVCPVLAGGRHGAFALSEAGAGSDPGGMMTTAVLEDGEWVINGTKQWISHGDTAAFLVVWARTDGAGPRGLSCFLVPEGTPGLSVASHEDKMGLRASHTVSLAFEDMRLPESALLGPRGGGFRIAMMALDGGRIGIASQAQGIGEAAYAEALEFVRGRGGDQGLTFRLADMRTRLDAARLLALRAAVLKERGVPFSQEASIAKAFATEAAWWVCNQAVEILGDQGLVRGGAAERALRDVRVTRIYEGTSEVQRIVISRGALRG
ncbi:MAG: acyl-CoA dehydrogenase [Sandaracinus sp.]|nr:acyl-CoA dehydrogenase [Sandaracinus sp.]|tara:strand:- start:926 stop:2029 length:1104 start_codon:yes stop_codon:yes gene_type:complete